MLTITYNGKTIKAQLVDLVRASSVMHRSFSFCLQCPGCVYAQLDLSPGVYDALTHPGAHGTPTNPTGPIYGTWDYAGSGGSTGPSSPSSGGNRIHPNGDSSKCLDVQGGKFANGTPVQMYACQTSDV